MDIQVYERKQFDRHPLSVMIRAILAVKYGMRF